MLKWISMFAVFAFASVASAAEEISTEAITSMDDGTTTTSVVFSYASCEEECHVATLTCSGNSVTLVLGDVAAENAAKAIAQETEQILFTVNGKAYDYFVGEMQFAEMTGSWWLTAHEQGSGPAEISQAIAASKSVEVQAGTMKVLLPVDKTTKRWAEACK